MCYGFYKLYESDKKYEDKVIYVVLLNSTFAILNILIRYKFVVFCFIFELIKTFKIDDIFDKTRDKKEKDELSTRDYIFFFGMCIFFTLHIVGVSWLLIEPQEDQVNFSLYIKSLYFATTTLATVGYGDITPKTDLGRLFTILIMLIGVGAYSLVVAKISSTLLENNKRKVNEKEKLDTLNSMLKHHEISDKLSKQTREFYKHIMEKKTNEKEEEILSSLPLGIRQEIEVEIKIKALKKLRIFKECGLNVLMDAAKMLEEIHVNQGEYIIKEGEEGGGLYLIDHGVVTVKNKDKGFLALLKDGDSFGEVTALDGGLRSASVVAETYSDISVLSKKSLEELVNKHKILIDNINVLREKRLR